MRSILTVFIMTGISATVGLAAPVKAGQPLYDQACKSCHGADGTPNATLAKMMKVDIGDLKSPEVQSMSNDALKKVITDGKGKMKPVTSVTGSDLDDVVAYVRSLKK
jgi:mono/diheme cytochrome c family protein